VLRAEIPVTGGGAREPVAMTVGGLADRTLVPVNAGTAVVPVAERVADLAVTAEAPVIGAGV